MTVEQKINMVAAYAGISQAELARRIGVSPANFNLRIKRGTLKKDDMDNIAAAIGAAYEFKFVFPDGTII